MGILMVVAAAQAQDVPPGRWWHSAQVVQQLQLTDGEVRQLEQAFEASRIQMIQLKSQVESEQFKLKTMMEKGNADDAAVKAQHHSLEAARSALADERFAFFVKTRDIIGNERFQKLLNMAPTGRKGHR
jgi:Spy/CpxP family protein refolding chaperone